MAVGPENFHMLLIKMTEFENRRNCFIFVCFFFKEASALVSIEGEFRIVLCCFAFSEIKLISFSYQLFDYFL